MAHYSRLRKVVIDIPPGDHDRELEFWQAAIGRSFVRNENDPTYHGLRLPGQDFVLLTQRLDDGPGRVHLDIHTDDLQAEVTRLEGLGAKRVREVNGLWIMQDPAGLPFCVIRDTREPLDDSNAQRWD